MELCEGSLHSAIVDKNKAAPDLEVRIKLLRDVACGLRYLHEEMHVLHRYIKAGNVLVDVRGSLWLIDFASTGPDKNPFSDAAKMVAALLFEYLPIPLSINEVRAASIQKLRDALAIPSDELAAYLKEAFAECICELVDSVPHSTAQRTFSQTDMRANTLVTWNDRDRPRRMSRMFSFSRY